MTATAGVRRPVGELLREWRDRRRISQLDLAHSADISTRHISFVETGRAAPSRDMVLRLGEHLDVPLRERNQLLLAAGFAPVYAERRIDDPELVAAREAVRRLLRSHEPFPALVVDRQWNLVDANDAATVLIEGAAAELLRPPTNVLRLSLHPDGLAPRIVNLGEWRAHLLGRLRREVAATADELLAELLAELREYPCAQAVPEVEVPGPQDIMVPLRIRHGDRVLALYSTVATFGTPMDVTLAELSIESFFPADESTSAVLRATSR